MSEQVKSFEEIVPVLEGSLNAWVRLVGFVRCNYAMDEFWNGKDELKFRRNGKTLLTLYVRQGYFTALIIYGKQEREKFEMGLDGFSGFARQYYENSKTFHDGKWMCIDIKEETHIDELIDMVRIKRKPNRKLEVLTNALMGKCGNRCDQCLLYEKNNEATGGRFEFQQGDWKCYHSGDPGAGHDYSNYICMGCHSTCAVVECAALKGYESCMECDYHTCDVTTNNFTNPGKCNLGLSSEDIEKFVLPYCGRERFDRMKQTP